MRNKILSLMIAGFSGKRADELEPEFIDMLKGGLGGVVLFGYNIGTEEELKSLIEKIKHYGKKNIFIAIDQEGGKVARLRESKGYQEFLSAKRVAAHFSPEEAEDYYRGMGKMLAGLGFNLDFGPVVDLEDENCQIIAGHERAYSSDPTIVYAYAESFMKALNDYDINTCLKHFPGHGFAREDSHEGLTDVTAYANLELELKPYYLLAAKAKMIMTAHVINKNYDAKCPVTLSPHYIKPILRDKIKFKGIVVADDLMMKAILDFYTVKEAFVLASLAGVNMMIISLFQGSTLDASGKTERISFCNVVEELVNEYAVNPEFARSVDDSKLLLG